MEDNIKALLREFEEMKIEVRGSMEALTVKVDGLSSWKPDLDARFGGLQQTVTQIQEQLRTTTTSPTGGSSPSTTAPTDGPPPSGTNKGSILGVAPSVGVTHGQIGHGDVFTNGVCVLGNASFSTPPPVTGMTNVQSPLCASMDLASRSGVSMGRLFQGVGQGSSATPFTQFDGENP